MKLPAPVSEQGRGFAVVADEVRKLAECTAQSAHEITTSVQETASSAAAEMNEGRELIEQGVQRVEGTRGVLAEMERSALEVHQRASGASVALAEQSAASQEISRNVEVIARMSEESEQRSGEALHAVHSLITQAKGLLTAVDKFHIRG